MSARRLIAVLYCMVVDWQAFSEEDEERRQKIIRDLDWPDVAAVSDLERSDAQARKALAALGLSMPMMGGGE